MRVVVDTNVLVSAVILPASRVGGVILQLRQHKFTPLYSAETLEELARTLARPRIRTKYYVTDADVRTVLELILLQGEAVDPVERVAVCRDPKDDIFLSVAVAGRADLIVTGDNDLLRLHSFRGIPIVTPTTLLATLDA